MSSLLIVISTFKVKEGKLEDLQRYYEKVLDIVEANEPRVIAFHGFPNVESTESEIGNGTCSRILNLAQDVRTNVGAQRFPCHHLYRSAEELLQKERQIHKIVERLPGSRRCGLDVRPSPGGRWQSPLPASSLAPQPTHPPKRRHPFAAVQL